MSQSIANRAVTTPDNLDVIGRPQMARADIGQTTSLSPVVKHSAKRTYGKQGAAAAHLGKDESNFSRDVDAGRLTLRDLEALGPQFLATLGSGLVEQYGVLTDPKARIRQVIRTIRDGLHEVEQFLDVA